MFDNTQPTIGEILDRQGVSRRAFLKYCAGMASLMALPASMGPAFAEQLRQSRRPSVIYLSFQECTGCVESFTRSFSPALENLIFNVISLDYDDTLMAAAGFQAEHAREQAMQENYGKYLIVVDGAVPTGNGGVYNTQAGRTAVDILTEAAAGAAAIICVGTCSSFGGLPFANPNPTGARPVSDIITDRPIVNIPGCPPIADVITGTLLQYITLGQLPELDDQLRPKVFYGNTIHDRCYRRPFYDQGKFAHAFDDEGARNGWCLFELGCKGPVTYNACATVKWNDGVSYPIQSGHGCLGCSEPNFWDKGSFYSALAAPDWGKAGRITPTLAADVVGKAAVVGAVAGAVSAGLARSRQTKQQKED